MSEKSKCILVRTAIKAVLAIAPIVGIYLLVASVMPEKVIELSINWVKCLTGLLLIIIGTTLYKHIFKRGGDR